MAVVSVLRVLKPHANLVSFGVFAPHDVNTDVAAERFVVLPHLVLASLACPNSWRCRAFAC